MTWQCRRICSTLNNSPPYVYSVNPLQITYVCTVAPKDRVSELFSRSCDFPVKLLFSRFGFRIEQLDFFNMYPQCIRESSLFVYTFLHDGYLLVTFPPFIYLYILYKYIYIIYLYMYYNIYYRENLLNYGSIIYCIGIISEKRFNKVVLKFDSDSFYGILLGPL